MSMELKLSNQDRATLKKLTAALDKVARELGKDRAQAPKSPSRLSEPYTDDPATKIPPSVTLSSETVQAIAKAVETGPEV